MLITEDNTLHTLGIQPIQKLVMDAAMSAAGLSVERSTGTLKVCNGATRMIMQPEINYTFHSVGGGPHDGCSTLEGRLLTFRRPVGAFSVSAGAPAPGSSFD